MTKIHFVDKKNNIFQLIYKFMNYNLKKKNIPIITLGRWKIENDSNKTNIKIDNANEDHCGTCSHSKKNN